MFSTCIYFVDPESIECKDELGRIWTRDINLEVSLLILYATG